MQADIDHVLLSEQELDEVVTRLAAEIDRDYSGSGRDLLLICILKGAVVFMGDLMKKLKMPVDIDFMRVSSYGAGSMSSGRINIILDIQHASLADHDVLIVEDIIDSGKTLSYLSEYLRINGASSVRTCTLLDKPSRREVDFTPNYVGREIPDEFVVGYGLDYAERYRTLPYIGVLKPEIYS